MAYEINYNSHKYYFNVGSLQMVFKVLLWRQNDFETPD